MVLDDAHWADASSLRAGGHMAHRLDGVRTAFLLATRDDEPSSNRELVRELIEGADAHLVRPRSFSTGSVSEVLRREFGSDPADGLVQACERVSGGNPFFLTELARDLGSTHDDPAAVRPDAVDGAGPLPVRRYLLGRLDRLGSDPRALAQALAVLGGEGEPAHAAAIAGLDEASARAAADTLAEAGIVDGGEPLRMIHPLMRSAVAAELEGAGAVAMHRRAYEVLRDAGVGQDALTRHALLSSSSGDPQVVELLMSSARLALRTGAPGTAAVHLRRALAEPPGPEERGTVLATLGQAEVRTGAFADGRAHLEQALGLLQDPGERLEAHRERAFAAFAAGGIGEARRVVEPALEGLDGHADDDVLQMEADLGLLAWLSGGEQDQGLRTYLDLPGRTRAERTMLSLLAQSEHAAGASPDAVVELAERALRGGLIEHDSSEALSWYMATYALLTCEAHDAARATIEEALADGHRRGSVFARAGALGCRAVLALNEGRPRDAEADARTAAQGSIPPIMAPVNTAYIVLALVDQGDAEGAQAELAGAGLDQFDGPTVLRWVPWARARLGEASGDLDAVRAAVQGMEADDAVGQPMRALAWRALLARVLARHGDDAAGASDLAARHLEWAEAWGRPCALGVAQRAAALAGPPGARAAALEDAVATLAASSLRTEEARARADLGVTLLRQGQRRDGRAQLETALEVALACGARGIARAASSELEVAGAPARRLAFDELTASERRVAQLAAGGATNRAIAEELFVTPKTVENHLTRVYAKLDIASRADLQAAL
jgi:DNA-binding CsgD family transcriptional regulator/Tfp pilus assembly protein PilF